MIKHHSFYKDSGFANSDAEATGTPAATELSEVVRGLANYLFLCFGSAWLCLARLGSARIGWYRVGLDPLGLALLGSAWHGFARLDTAGLGWGRLGSC